jgi:hypothetical protein
MDINHDLGLISNGIKTIDLMQVPPLGGIVGVLELVGNGALIVPAGTTTQRPSPPQAAMVRFNQDTNTLEFYDGTSWGSIGQGTVTSVAVTGSPGLTVSGSPITTAGTITLTLGTELQGLAGLSTNGLIARSGAGAYVPRMITGVAGHIVVTDGNGVAGNPTIDLAPVTVGSGGTFQKLTVDGFGRVTAVSAVAASDITALVDTVYVNASGDSMSGPLNMGGNQITNLGAPVSGSDAATKNYVDAAVAGLSWKQAVRVATTAAGNLNTDFEAGDVVDGVTLAAGDRILIKNQASPAENGIYVVQASGAPVRAEDANAGAELVSAAVYVDEGTVNADTGWLQTTNAPITLGTTALVWTQFSGSSTYTAGTGLTLTGNTFALAIPVATNHGGTGLTAIGTANQVLGVNAGATGLEYKTIAAGTGISVTHGAGTVTIDNTGVTSVALAAPSIFTVSGSPVTTTGTLTLALASQAAGTVFAAPANSSGTPSFRALVYSDLPVKLYSENPVSPTAPSATGNNAVAIGSGAAASAAGALGVGAGSDANIFGVQAFANGSFASAGDAQRVQAVLRNQTTSAAITELFLDGASGTQRFVLPNNSVVTFQLLITARRTDATGGGAGYRLEGVIRKDTTPASTTFVGSPSKSILGETNAAWDANVAVDATNGALRVNVTGEAGKTIRWVAVLTAAVVTN